MDAGLEQIDGTINIIVDRSLYGAQRANFNDYVEARIGVLIPASKSFLTSIQDNAHVFKP
jgi:hypothetical protein